MTGTPTEVPEPRKVHTNDIGPTLPSLRPALQEPSGTLSASGISMKSQAPPYLLTKLAIFPDLKFARSDRSQRPSRGRLDELVRFMSNVEALDEEIQWK
jgi:hypothetical protein